MGAAGASSTSVTVFSTHLCYLWTLICHLFIQNTNDDNLGPLGLTRSNRASNVREL